MLDRHDLTDQEWARLEPLLPVRKPCRGGRWADHRTVLNGVFWRTFSGSPKKPAAKPGREALGRFRGGLTSKIHLVADTRCRPVSRVATAGHRNDSLAFEPVMAGIRIGRRGQGRPRTRPGQVLADKAYSSRAIRAHLRRRRIAATIPEPTDQQTNRLRRGRQGGRPPSFDAQAYKQRHVVERCINKLKGYRRVGYSCVSLRWRRAGRFAHH